MCEKRDSGDHSGSAREPSGKVRKELASGASAERTEELLAWFAFQEQRERFMKAQRKREGRERRANAVIDPALVNLPLPHLLN